MKRLGSLVCIAAGLLLGSTGTSNAATLLTFTGHFNAYLDGSPLLPGNTPFSLRAIFDTSHSESVPDPAHTGVYSVISGDLQLPSGLYQIGPDANLGVFLYSANGDPAATDGPFLAGFGELSGEKLVARFNTAAPGFDATSPTATIFSGFVNYFDAPLPTIRLDGGAHILKIASRSSAAPTAEISFRLGSSLPPPDPLTVPVPSTLLMIFAFLLTCMGLTSTKFRAMALGF